MVIVKAIFLSKNDFSKKIKEIIQFQTRHCSGPKKIFRATATKTFLLKSGTGLRYISWLRSMFCDLSLILHCPHIWCDKLIISLPLQLLQIQFFMLELSTLIEVDCHYVREKVVNREVQVHFF